MNEWATLNVTWAGANGDLKERVPYDVSDRELKSMAAEAIRNGDISGIPADRRVNLHDFVVDRFSATPQVPFHRVFIRPKTPFGND